MTNSYSLLPGPPSKPPPLTSNTPDTTKPMQGDPPEWAPFSPELRLLLRGLQVDKERIPDEAPLGIDWDHLLHLLHLHRLVPRLAPWLRGLDGTPVPVAERLSAMERTCAALSLRLAGELVRLAKAFDERGIPFLSVKGPLLAQRLYGSVAGRQFTDLDLLVPREKAWEAMRMLEGEGFQPPLPVPKGYEEKLFRIQQEDRHMHPDGRVVEIHWALLPPRWGVDTITQEAWDGAGTQELGGVQIRVPGWDAHLKFLVLHGHKHHWMRLQWLVDVAEAMRQDPGLRARLAEGLAGWRRSAEATWATSDLLFSSTADAPRLAGARKLQKTILRQLATDEAAELGHVGRRVYRAASLDRARDRARYALDLARPTKSDWNWVRFPAALSGLHYVTRPVRVLLRQDPAPH